MGSVIWLYIVYSDITAMSVEWHYQPTWERMLNFHSSFLWTPPVYWMMKQIFQCHMRTKYSLRIVGFEGTHIHKEYWCDELFYSENILCQFSQKTLYRDKFSMTLSYVVDLIDVKIESTFAAEFSLLHQPRYHLFTKISKLRTCDSSWK